MLFGINLPVFSSSTSGLSGQLMSRFTPRTLIKWGLAGTAIGGIASYVSGFGSALGYGHAAGLTLPQNQYASGYNFQLGMAEGRAAGSATPQSSYDAYVARRERAAMEYMKLHGGYL